MIIKPMQINWDLRANFDLSEPEAGTAGISAKNRYRTSS